MPQAHVIRYGRPSQLTKSRKIESVKYSFTRFPYLCTQKAKAAMVKSVSGIKDRFKPINMSRKRRHSNNENEVIGKLAGAAVAAIVTKVVTEVLLKL